MSKDSNNTMEGGQEEPNPNPNPNPNSQCAASFTINPFASKYQPAITYIHTYIHTCLYS